MIGWIILGAIVLIIILVLCLRVGVRVEFGDALRVTAQVGFIRMQLIPPPERARKKPPKAQKNAPEGAGKAQKKNRKKLDLHPTGADIRAALSAVWRAVQGALRRAGHRLRIDPMEVQVIIADGDPVNTAQWYGWACTAMWTVLPRLEELHQLPDPHVHLEMDFSSTKTRAYGTVGIRYRVGDMLAIGFAAAWPLLRFGVPFLRRQRALQRAEEKRAAAEKTAETTNSATDAPTDAA